MLKKIRSLFSRRTSGPAAGSGDKTVDPAGPGAPDEASTATDRPAVHHGPSAVHRPIDRVDLDPDAVKIVERLTRFDHTAYLVGGCVRDLLLDMKPKDFDVGTSATPRQVRRLFRNSRIIGRRFRLAHIFFQSSKIIEVATFRAREDAEPDAEDGDLMIRDDNLFGSPEEDALRRDFTVNQLFYDLNRETVLDHAGGLDDLRRRLIRTIGDPDIRFQEDPIRVLRAIRFAARLNFRIETKTLEALRRHRGDISKAAAPRVLEEINKFVRGGNAQPSFEMLRETGTFQVILPEIHEAYARDDAAWKSFMASLEALDRRSADVPEVATGLVLALMLLPVVRARLGWRADGTIQRERGVPLRELIDSALKPLALRLRVARKDQEHCRQIFVSLFRMAPIQGLRSNTRRAILERACLPDAVWVLGLEAAGCGGVFEEAREYWDRVEVPDGPRPPRTGRDESGAEGTDGDSEGPTGTRSRRSRSRRRGGASRRRSGRESETGAESPKATTKPAQPAPTAKKSVPAKKPREPWNENSFFDALPTVPAMEGEETDANRYGAGRIAGAEAPEGRSPRVAREGSPDDPPRPAPPTSDTSDRSGDAAEAQEGDAAAGARTDEAGSETPKPRRRRRSRRRRRPRSEGSDTETAPTGSSSED